MDVDCSDLDSGKEEEEVESTSLKPVANDVKVPEAKEIENLGKI